MTTNANTQAIANMNPEQMPIPDHKLRGWRPASEDQPTNQQPGK